MAKRATSTVVGLAVRVQKAGVAVGERTARAVSAAWVAVSTRPVMTALKITARAISTVEEPVVHPARWVGDASSTVTVGVGSAVRGSVSPRPVRMRSRTRMRSRRTVAAPVVSALWRASANEAQSARADDA